MVDRRADHQGLQRNISALRARPPLPAATPWSTTPLDASDLTAPSVVVLLGSFGRAIRTQQRPVHAQCHAQRDAVRRRQSAARRRPTRWSATSPTSRGRRKTSTPRTIARRPTTNPLDGRMVDEHIYWHTNIDGDPVQLPRVDGIPRLARRVHPSFRSVAAGVRLQPCRALVSGPAASDRPAIRRRRGLAAIAYVADNNRIPTYYTIAGGHDRRCSAARLKLADYATLDDFTCSFERGFHGQVHCNIGVPSAAASSRPAARVTAACAMRARPRTRCSGAGTASSTRCTATTARSEPAPAPRLRPPILRPIPGWPTIQPTLRTTARSPRPASTGSAPTYGTDERK